MVIFFTVFLIIGRHSTEWQTPESGFLKYSWEIPRTRGSETLGDHWRVATVQPHICLYVRSMFEIWGSVALEKLKNWDAERKVPKPQKHCSSLDDIWISFCTTAALIFRYLSSQFSKFCENYIQQLSFEIFYSSSFPASEILSQCIHFQLGARSEKALLHLN